MNDWHSKKMISEISPNTKNQPYLQAMAAYINCNVSFLGFKLDFWCSGSMSSEADEKELTMSVFEKQMLKLII
jgi:hypothetical protein